MFYCNILFATLSLLTLQKQIWDIPTNYGVNQLSQILHLIEWIPNPLVGLSTEQGGILPVITMCSLVKNVVNEKYNQVNEISEYIIVNNPLLDLCQC